MWRRNNYKIVSTQRDLCSGSQLHNCNAELLTVNVVSEAAKSLSLAEKDCVEQPSTGDLLVTEPTPPPPGPPVDDAPPIQPSGGSSSAGSGTRSGGGKKKKKSRSVENRGLNDDAY